MNKFFGSTVFGLVVILAIISGNLNVAGTGRMLLGMLAGAINGGLQSTSDRQPVVNNYNFGSDSSNGYGTHPDCAPGATNCIPK